MTVEMPGFGLDACDHDWVDIGIVTTKEINRAVRTHYGKSKLAVSVYQSTGFTVWVNSNGVVVEEGDLHKLVCLKCKECKNPMERIMGEIIAGVDEAEARAKRKEQAEKIWKEDCCFNDVQTSA